MNGFLYGVELQWKLDIRSKSLLVTCYVVPLVFFLFMGGIFTSVMPEMRSTLIQSMIVMSVSMGAFIGLPPSLIETYGSDVKKVYKANGVPLYLGLVTMFLSAFVHLMISCAIILLLAPILFEAALPVQLPFFFLALAIYIIVSLSIGSILGLVVKNQAKLTMIAQLVFLPSIMLSGIMFPIDLLPDFLEIKTDAIVNDLFADLPKLHPGESSDKYAKTKATSYVTESGIRTKDDVLTHHNCRPNIDRDIKIYRRAVELWNDGHKRLNYNDLPDELKTHKNRHSFTDRFKVVEGDESCCHTILAHLSKDGHYFIHPDIEQNRSITVREAARIQSFPDSYFFEGPRTSQFVQIGNAVPPMMAKGIAMGIFEQLYKGDSDGR